MNQTPVVYIVFNRPQHTERTFAVLREQRPSQLFIVADGPRPGHPADVERCKAVRDIVAQVSWPCEVHRNYADINLGLKCRVSTGLDWVFEHVERAIVLEDDCVAHPDFFSFCDQLLDRYAEDERVSVITGNNFQDGCKRGDASYYFSKYNHCWGWATWRRAWRWYQGELPFWPEWAQSQDWYEKTPDPVERQYWSGIFDQVKAGKIDTWDYPWTASVWYRGGLTATPNVNLVSNIGFGEDATHTTSTQSQHADMRVYPLGGLEHPDSIGRDEAADAFVFEQNFKGSSPGYFRSWLAFPRRIAAYVFRRINGFISGCTR